MYRIRLENLLVQGFSFPKEEQEYLSRHYDQNYLQHNYSLKIKNRQEKKMLIQIKNGLLRIPVISQVLVWGDEWKLHLLL